MELNPVLREHTAEIIENFIASKVKDAHSDGVVLGLSGGLDSTVVAKLCADALGPKKVLGICMPSGPQQQGDTREAPGYAKKIGIQCKTVPIPDMLKCFKSSFDMKGKDIADANLAPRVRMIVLFYHANCLNRLVMGTGNKSELLMGYFTKFGDGGADYLPIGDLYKTQVRELARELDVPSKFIKKPPTAGLWKGQTDEGEMGITYANLDKILSGIELGCSDDEIRERTGLPLKEIKRIHDTVLRTVHKRKMPLIPKIGIRTIGMDWRE